MVVLVVAGGASIGGAFGNVPGAFFGSLLAPILFSLIRKRSKKLTQT